MWSGNLPRTSIHWTLLLLCAIGFQPVASPVANRCHAAEPVARMTEVPPSTGGNAFYIANRPPLLPSPLIKLPIGNIRPEGWLRHQLELMADGMIGRLTEISPWCAFDGNAWTDPHGQGEHGWEELPYWLKGFIDLGYILEDQRIIDEANRWLDAVLASQRPDGYFGDERNRQRHDLWPNMVMLYALRTLHEATGDERIIPFMNRYFRWQTTVPLEHFLPGSWQKWRAGDNLDSIHWLYNRTGEDWLLDLARINHECTAQWHQGFPTWHGVNITQCFRAPAQYYQQVPDSRYLAATVRNYDTVMSIYGQVPGGMFGADENARTGFVGPRQAAETCSMVEFMHSFEMLLKITGDTVWADRCEDVAFNSLPAAMTPDLKGLHYLTAPNQVQLDRHNKAPMLDNGGDMFSYTPYEQYRCCQHNVAFGWPYYAAHLWLATQGNGLAAALYADSTVTARVGEGVEVQVRQTTDYPFDERVQFELTTPRPVAFPLMLRVPGWCEAPRVKVNGEPLEVAATPRTWIVIQRTWHDGDRVELELPASIRVRVWETNGNTVSVDRGPLTYSLRIGERWAEYDNDRPWAAYEVFPSTPWNYGLIVDTDHPSTSFELVRSGGSLAAQPFTPDAAPLALKARGLRIPQWMLENNGLVGQIPRSPISSQEPVEDIVLIPMGAARLRISAFPRIDDSAPSEAPATPRTLQVTASHVHNTLDALNDGVVPERSNDRSVPRFTWWNRRGTGEWVQYEFPEPRTISWTEVFWFDDTDTGQCHVPVGWRLIYRDGETWREVQEASGYGVRKHRFNRVTFKPVTTTQVRLIADLQPDYSGGILEWRVGE
jgi:hypothetical protein